jgi:stage III sporulation protein AE
MTKKKVLKLTQIFLFAVAAVVSAVALSYDGVAEAKVGTNEGLDEVIDELDTNTQNRIDSLDTDLFEKFLTSLDEEQRQALGFEDLKGFLRGLTEGKTDNFFENFVGSLLKSLGKYFAGFLPSILAIIAVSLLKSMLSGMTSGFQKTGTTEIVHVVCYGVVVVLLSSSLVSVVKTTATTIHNMTAFAEGVFPVLLTLLAGLGSTTGVATYQPMMAVLGGGVMKVVTTVILPAFVACAVFAVVGNLSKNVKLSKMNKMLKSASSWLIGIVFGLYGTFLTVGGISGGIIDKVGYNAAKFALSSYVPILGGYLSDGFDLISASVVLVKNAFGHTAVIVLVGIVLFPLLKIVIFTLSLRLASAVVEPIGDDRVSTVLTSVADNASLLMSALAGVGFMFFVLIMLIIGSFNVV